MFRGKESSNRIELSRLVQDLLNFGVLGSLRLWGGWVDWGREGWGVPPIHMHTCTCMHGKHDNSIQMAAPIGFGEIPGIPYDVISACACMCTCVGGPCHHPHPHLPTPSPPRGDPRNQSKFNSTWTNQDISILFEDLKSVETSPPMGGCIISWVGGWVDGWGQVKSLKI